ncbi:EamA/RhaT family transporter [Roseobacter denitrificans]|uniref:Membrane protein, putative n=1 Tax=Roseobacter denitrificans (strain ATCC 33942 / OCh 114) TaxID=375451 RepID=Q168R7_ROSDO|nr:DMT family transporter [Roseobacter denitrificans]ABG31526.1 membrane protein, putative [Roseobacter denitrificans OCh 114]AVL54525.1 EamA/RhaT family transporter [Roseobacter denitrificans]SFF90353.1 Threonine/homoserine efflux transporter RhtA [Roseobacter denitrificans OCh 114]
MTIDRPFLGIMLMLGFCVLAPVGDAIAKILGQTVPIGQLVLVRFAVQAVLLIPLVWLTHRHWRMSKRVTWLTFLRTILHILGIGAMVTALKYLPLADAIAIAFVMPFIMLVLGKFALGEEVGARRIIACAVGFLGTLLVVQPSFAQVGWPALLPVGVAINFALFMLVTRQIAKETDPISLQAVSGVMAVFVILPILLIFQNSSFLQLRIVNVSSHDWALLLSIGVLGTVAHLLMTWSLRFAPSATLAPMQYLEIPFATILGFIVFGDFPNPVASLGIMITIAAGLYVVLRERAIALSLKAPAQPAEETRAA